MPIVQISRIQHRRGLATDLPQLAAGELGWAIDDQRLYIGNGKVSDGAPAVGITEILTTGSSGFSAALNYIYKGYRQDGTILTGVNVNSPVKRTLQERLDDYVSIKSFGAKGDFNTDTLVGTDNTTFIQKALNQLYVNSDKDNVQSRRILFLPAGIYKITDTLYLPPYTQIVGEGKHKTIIRSTGTGPILQTVDNSGSATENTWTGNVYPNLSGTLPRDISCDGITFQTMTNYAGANIDMASNVNFYNCLFIGAYVTNGSDVSSLDPTNSTGRGITTRSTTASPCTNITFDNCTITKFARLVDVSYDTTTMKFLNCKFSIARFGAVIGERVDGSTNGLTIGPRDIKFVLSQFDSIYENGIFVSSSVSNGGGTGVARNVVSFNNYFAHTVGTAGTGVDQINSSPILKFDADECVSFLDYFESDRKRTPNQANKITPQTEVEGIGLNTKSIREKTLDASASNSNMLVLSNTESKKIVIEYKINKGSNYRSGTFTITSSLTTLSYNDEFDENDDVGISFTASLSNYDSTAGNDTILIKYSNASADDATITYQLSELV